MSRRGEAAAARRLVLESAAAAGTCHIGSSLSIVDALVVLHHDVLRRERDRCLLSKGHAASALYAVLAGVGVLDRDEVLRGYCSDGGSLPGHPERGLPGVEMTGGSLGHGLAIAVGLALADRHDGSDARTFCLLGDGELNEGSVWEAAALAAHLRLDAITAVVDANGLQGLGRTRDVVALDAAGAFAAFGWDVREADGHDHDALRAALAPSGGRPTAVVARTVKGHGVDFMEDELMWHYRPLRSPDLERALAQVTPRRRAA